VLLSSALPFALVAETKVFINVVSPPFRLCHRPLRSTRLRG